MGMGEQKREIYQTKKVPVTVFWASVITIWSGLRSDQEVLIGHKANL